MSEGKEHFSSSTLPCRNLKMMIFEELQEAPLCTNQVQYSSLLESTSNRCRHARHLTCADRNGTFQGRCWVLTMVLARSKRVHFKAVDDAQGFLCEAIWARYQSALSQPISNLPCRDCLLQPCLFAPHGRGMMATELSVQQLQRVWSPCLLAWAPSLQQTSG